MIRVSAILKTQRVLKNPDHSHSLPLGCSITRNIKNIIVIFDWSKLLHVLLNLTDLLEKNYDSGKRLGDWQPVRLSTLHFTSLRSRVGFHG